jgi:hypothetical protein
MEYYIDISRQLIAKVRISNISRHHLNVLELGHFFQPPPRIKRVVQNQGAYVRTLILQKLHEMRTDKAIRSCDENASSRYIHEE